MYVSARKIWRISAEFAAVLLNFRLGGVGDSRAHAHRCGSPRHLLEATNSRGANTDSARTRDVTRSF